MTRCSLDRDRSYRVVMTEKEWENLFARYLRCRAAAGEAESPGFTPCAFTFTEAVAEYAAALDIPLDQHVQRLETAARN